MHARLAMILSIGGVLAAGTAAAVVNSEVLRQDATPPVTAPLQPLRPAETAIAPASAVDAASGPAPTTTTPVTSPTPAPTVSAAPTVVPTSPAPTEVVTPGASLPASATQQSFRLGDAATAVLDTAGGELTIVSVTPQPGWEVERAEQEELAAVEIRLRSADDEVRFEASLVRGVVVVSLRTDDDGDEGGDDHDDGADDDSSGRGSGRSGGGDD